MRFLGMNLDTKDRVVLLSGLADLPAHSLSAVCCGADEHNRSIRLGDEGSAIGLPFLIERLMK